MSAIMICVAESVEYNSLSKSKSEYSRSREWDLKTDQPSRSGPNESLENPFAVWSFLV